MTFFRRPEDVLKTSVSTGVNSLYLIIGKMSGCFEEINESKCSTLIHTNKSKEIMEACEELWSKIRDLYRSISKNSGDYDE